MDMQIVACEKKPIIDHIIDNLYLGDFVAANNILFPKDISVLSKKDNLQIVIVNISGTTYKVPEGIEYTFFPLDDSRNEDISIYFDAIVTIVNEAKKKESRVLVHCANAVSRSVTLVLYYLMKEHNMDLKTAIEFLKSKRSPTQPTRPNTGFFKQLVEAERNLGYAKSMAIKDFY